MNVSQPDVLAVDRTAVRVASFEEAQREDREFWWSQTPIARLRHVEVLREMNYGSEAINQRLQRVLEVSERPRR